MKLKLAGGTPKSGKGDAGVGQAPAGQSRSVSPAPAAQSAKPVAPAAPAAAAKESSVPEVEGPHAFPPLTEEEMRRHYAGGCEGQRVRRGGMGLLGLVFGRWGAAFWFKQVAL